MVEGVDDVDDGIGGGAPLYKGMKILLALNQVNLVLSHIIPVD